MNQQNYELVGEAITEDIHGFSVSVIEYPNRPESLRWKVKVEVDEVRGEIVAMAYNNQKHKAIQDAIDNLRDKLKAIEAVIGCLESINAR